MSGSVRCFMRFNFPMLTTSLCRTTNFNQRRTLFSADMLGITAYNKVRDIYRNQFLNLEDSFREKMKNYVAANTNEMIFTEDLKAMLHIVEKTPEDIELLKKMIKKFNHQDGQMRFGTYTFGPIVMRAFYRLNEWELAYEMFNDPEFVCFFNQLITYQIFLDLLYCNEQYSKMRESYNKIKQRLPHNKTHPKNALILVTAACYRENTPESFEYAKNLWHELNNRGYLPIRRVITHIAALAINQGEPHVALEILSASSKPNYVGIRCLKVMAYADINRVEDVIPIFRYSLENNDPTSKNKTYFKDAIEKVEASIQRNDISPDNEVVKLLNLIKNNGLVQKQTIADHISTEIVFSPRLDSENSLTRNGRQNFDDRGTRIIRRPGLRDIV